jgi:hypothetical protein
MGHPAESPFIIIVIVIITAGFSVGYEGISGASPRDSTGGR